MSEIMTGLARVEIKPLFASKRWNQLCLDLQQQDRLQLNQVQVLNYYLIKAPEKNLSQALATQYAEVFCDSILEQMQTDEQADFLPQACQWIVDIAFKPGVTDNAAHALSEGLALLGLHCEARSGKLYCLNSQIKREEAQKIGEEHFGNTVIESVNCYSVEEFKQLRRFEQVQFPQVSLQPGQHVQLMPLGSEAELLKLSESRCLALDLVELKAIKQHYENLETQNYRKRQGLSVDPTDVELEVIAQTWSEHCKHKIFNSPIEYTDKNGKKTEYQSLFKQMIRKTTEDVIQARNLDWCISLFHDNAGVVRFDKNIDYCLKVETHNSPSALDPYGGALTGILGVNRDILGTGMGAKPMANMDVFCFGPLKGEDPKWEQELPANIKRPKQIFSGVHLGVEDGGNKSGIPTVNGSIYFDQSFSGKPLVFVGTLGVLPQTLHNKPASEKKASPGDKIVMVGGAIGADGIHGATFSSLELNESSPTSAVQIGDPLTQKRVWDFLLEARDLALYQALTDNGAGGLSSSVGEMAGMTGGARIDLALAPVKYPGLTPYELMISESQERMTVAVSKEQWPRFQALAQARGVSATALGEFTETGRLAISYHSELVADLDLNFLHDGLPKQKLPAKWDGPRERVVWSGLKTKTDLPSWEQRSRNEELIKLWLELLGTPNIASKEKWVRRYDHEVQASTHIKPFAGPTQQAPQNAAVLWAWPHGGERSSAVALGHGMNPRASLYDPYYMAKLAVDEALRNVVAQGGDPDTCALLDNFCWPNPVLAENNPDGDYKLGQLVRTCEGLREACLTFGTPLISGKDSMKNDYKGKNRKGETVKIHILPTLLVTALARAEMGRTCTSYFKNAGDVIYLIGPGQYESMGLLSSELAEIRSLSNEQLKMPTLELKTNQKIYQGIHRVISAGVLASCHDLSDGGLACALAESTFGAMLGAQVSLASLSNKFQQNFIPLLFSEAPGYFIASVAPEREAELASHFAKDQLYRLGQVTKTSDIEIVEAKLQVPLANLLLAWKQGVPS